MRLCVIIAILSAVIPAPAIGQEVIHLFRNDAFDLWTAQSGDAVPPGWSVEDGLVHFDPKRGKGGNILTAAEYGDFDLSFEFRIGSKGNSGIKYLVRKYDNRVLGCEYQILDDPTYAKLKPTQFTASLYDIKEPRNGHLVPGEFNRGRIVVRNGWIEHWLNGRLVVSTYRGSVDWNARVQQSKFRTVDDFSRNTTGRIMLTDHNSEVWYRNVVLRLPTASAGLSVRRPAGWSRCARGPRVCEEKRRRRQRCFGWRADGWVY